MKRIFIAFAAIATLVFVLAIPASAQDGPTITVDPASVDAAGEHEITVTGAGYTGPAFLLPCPGLGGDITATVAEDSCDTGSLTPVTPDADGAWEATATFDIPAEGLVLVAGNAAQTEVASAVVAVGAAEEAPAAEETAAAEETEALPATGVESVVLVIVGATALAAGFMMMRSRRDLGVQ